MAESPVLLFTPTPSEGHMTPALQITRYLVSKGYVVAMVTSANWQQHCEDSGAQFFPMLGLLESVRKLASSYPDAFYSAITGKPSPYLNDRQSHFARGEVFFIDGMPSSLESVRYALMALRKTYPNREILILADICCPGILPIRLGATIPGFQKPPKSIGINVVPPFWNSKEAPPLFSGLGFDGSEDGLFRNKLVASTYLNPNLPARLQEMLTRLGVSNRWDTPLEAYLNDDIHHSIYESWFVCHDTTLQMCIPSCEFPRMNWPAHCKFAGFLPIRPMPNSGLEHPPWLDELKRSRHPRGDLGASAKKILFVAQGTVVTNYDILITPTILAFADRDDMLIIANLCVRGAAYKLGDDRPLPSNVRVVDYYPYDALLPYVDVFVSNSGYGGLAHGVNHGVPLVQTGTTEDKMDVGRRVQYSGLGVYLNPVNEEGLRTAVNGVLVEPAYKRRALELKNQAESMRALERLEAEIVALI